MTGTTSATGPAGTLPGLWPIAPEAPLVVPIPGTWKSKDFQSDLNELASSLSPAFVLDYDTWYLGTTRDGMLVTSRIWEPWLRVPLADLVLVQPGTIGGLPGPIGWQLNTKHADEFVNSVRLENGPAVWLQTERDGFLFPTPYPTRLAAEIDRRRWRVARVGSPTAAAVWQANPALRVQGPYGPEPGMPPGTPSQPMLLQKPGRSWTPLRISRPEPVPPPAGSVSAHPEPLTDVPFPENLTDVALNIRESDPPLTVNVSNHRIRLSQQPLPGSSSPFYDPDIEYRKMYGKVATFLDKNLGEISTPSNLFEASQPYLSAPIVQFPVIRAGTLSGVPAGWSVRVLASDGRTEIRTDIVDGPAVWLWGMTHEWVICTPYAAQLAADLRQRRRIAALFPLSGQYPIEFLTWAAYPDTALVETEAGWCLPPTPPYAPHEPTIVPPGTWHTDPE